MSALLLVAMLATSHMECENELSLVEKANDGQYLRLSDGSKWSSGSGNWTPAYYWNQDDEMSICGRDTPWPILIDHTTNEERVDVQPFKGDVQPE